LLGDYNMRKRKLSNAEKVFRALIEFGPLSKWELKNRTSMPYPRVNEAIKSLERANYVRVVDKQISQKNLTMKIYGLTFKGALKHLASIELARPRTIGKPEETIEDFRKRLIVEYKRYFEQTKEITDFIHFHNEQLDFTIFQEIEWLSNSYGLIAYEMILEISKSILTSSSAYPFSKMAGQQNSEQRELRKRINMFKQKPFLRNMTIFIDSGQGQREEQEIDFLSDDINRLRHLEMEFSLLRKGENEFLKRAFAYSFLERVAFMKRKKGPGNKSLRKFAKNLLKIRKEQEITPLENVVRELGDFGL